GDRVRRRPSRLRAPPEALRSAERWLLPVARQGGGPPGNDRRGAAAHVLRPGFRRPRAEGARSCRGVARWQGPDRQGGAVPDSFAPRIGTRLEEEPPGRAVRGEDPVREGSASRSDRVVAGRKHRGVGPRRAPSRWVPPEARYAPGWAGWGGELSPNGARDRPGPP